MKGNVSQSGDATVVKYQYLKSGHVLLSTLSGERQDGRSSWRWGVTGDWEKYIRPSEERARRRRRDGRETLSVTTTYEGECGEESFLLLGLKIHHTCKQRCGSRGIIGVLLANGREVNKNKNKNELKELNNLCVSVQVQVYYNIYYYTTGLQFMSLVQQSQRKGNFKCVTAASSEETSTFLFPFAIHRPLTSICYANVPPLCLKVRSLLFTWMTTKKINGKNEETKHKALEIHICLRKSRAETDGRVPDVFRGQNLGVREGSLRDKHTQF